MTSSGPYRASPGAPPNTSFVHVRITRGATASAGHSSSTRHCELDEHRILPVATLASIGQQSGAMALAIGVRRRPEMPVAGPGGPDAPPGSPTAPTVPLSERLAGLPLQPPKPSASGKQRAAFLR